MASLAAFIRENKQQIVDDWLARVRALPAAEGLPEPVLADHAPQMIEALADALERTDAPPGALEQVPIEHATQRYHEGYELSEIVAEYRMLRRVLFETYQRAADPRISAIATLNDLVDRAIGDAVDRYAAEHDRTRDFFVAILGHDLQNPLTAITMNASRLLQISKDVQLIYPRVTELAVRVEASARRMERMVADLLDFARGRLGGGFPIAPVAADLKPVIAAAVQELVEAHPGREIQSLADSVPGDFSGVWDPDRLAQVVSNLGRYAIRSGDDPVVVEPRDDGARVSIMVSYRGEIPSERMSHLFDPFRTRTRKATGLGLFIVREIVQAHGGSIDVTSNAASGTVFRVDLPRRAPERAER